LIGTSTRRRPATSSRAQARRPARPAPTRKHARRRRKLLALVLTLGLIGVIALAVTGSVEKGLREFTLPLRHEDIIRQQARDKNLDPALIAAVIYQESKFQDRTSEAGARGLMQITPETAHFIADKSGGTRFTTEDLSTPQINISYGAWYLRWLIDHYDGNKTLAVAAYNAGQTNVNKWVERAGGEEDFDPARHIQFPETRAYVQSVLEREKQYRRHYAKELGIE
jgi:soluble lytic murein transglycosylase